MAVEVSTKPMALTKETVSEKPKASPTQVSSAAQATTWALPSPKICPLEQRHRHHGGAQPRDNLDQSVGAGFYSHGEPLESVADACAALRTWLQLACRSEIVEPKLPWRRDANATVPPSSPHTVDSYRMPAQAMSRSSRFGLLMVAPALALLAGCAAGVGVSVPIFPGVSLGVGAGSGGNVHVGVGTGVGPVGVGVGVNQSGRVSAGAGVGASVPVGNARVGAGVGTGTVIYDPKAKPAEQRAMPVPESPYVH